MFLTVSILLVLNSFIKNLLITKSSELTAVLFNGQASSLATRPGHRWPVQLHRRAPTMTFFTVLKLTLTTSSSHTCLTRLTYRTSFEPALTQWL